MSGGYTPVFNGALDGTLYGRWPQTGVWLCLLSQCDWRGNIDMVPRLLASKIGVSEDVLIACIREFMEPDSGSRTGDLEGRRLELIDPANRDWGWRVINHGLYRERARKSTYDAERTRSGADAERKRKGREKQGKQTVPRSPDVSRSQTQTQTQTETEIQTHTQGKSGLHTRPIPQDFGLTPKRRAVAEAAGLDPEATFTDFTERMKSRKLEVTNWDRFWSEWCRMMGKHSDKPARTASDDAVRLQ
jgi:hypothetical protein